MYQIKTIMIQRRINAIRHEFMKNMIYEMKQPPAKAADDATAIKIGSTLFFYELNELRHGNEKVIITSRQAELLRILADSPNKVVGREVLLKEVWGDDSYSNSMALNVQITYLAGSEERRRTKHRGNYKKGICAENHTKPIIRQRRKYYYKNEQARKKELYAQQPKTQNSQQAQRRMQAT